MFLLLSTGILWYGYAKIITSGSASRQLFFKFPKSKNGKCHEKPGPYCIQHARMEIKPQDNIAQGSGSVSIQSSTSHQKLQPSSCYFLCSQTQTLAFSTSSALLSIHQPEVRSKDTCGSKMLTLEKKITHCKPESLLVYLNEWKCACVCQLPIINTDTLPS